MANKKVEKVENMKNYKLIENLKTNMGKSIEDLFVEKAIDNLEDLIIEVEAQIAHIKTSRIPAAKNAVIRAERDLGKAIKEFENAKNDVVADLEKYVSKWNAGEAGVRKAEDEVSYKKACVDQEETSLKKYQEILDYLSEEI